MLFNKGKDGKLTSNLGYHNHVLNVYGGSTIPIPYTLPTIPTLVPFPVTKYRNKMRIGFFRSFLSIFIPSHL